MAELAAAAQAQKERAYYSRFDANKTRADFKLRVQPDDADLREGVLDYLVANPFQCSERCVALDLGEASDGGRRVAIVQGGGYVVIRLRQGATPGIEEPRADVYPPLKPDSVVEIGEGRVIRIDGKTVGPPLD